MANNHRNRNRNSNYDLALLYSYIGPGHAIYRVKECRGETKACEKLIGPYYEPGASMFYVSNPLTDEEFVAGIRVTEKVEGGKRVESRKFWKVPIPKQRGPRASKAVQTNSNSRNNLNSISNTMKKNVQV